MSCMWPRLCAVIDPESTHDNSYEMTAGFWNWMIVRSVSKRWVMMELNVLQCSFSRANSRNVYVVKRSCSRAVSFLYKVDGSTQVPTYDWINARRGTCRLLRKKAGSLHLILAFECNLRSNSVLSVSLKKKKCVFLRKCHSGGFTVYIDIRSLDILFVCIFCEIWRL